MRRRDPRNLLMVALVGCGALCLVAARRPWLESGPVGLSGDELTSGLTSGLGWMVEVAAVMLLVVSRFGRRVVGALVSAVGVGLVAVALAHRSVPAATWASRGVEAGAARAVTAWPWICLGAGVGVAGAGVALVATATRARRRVSRSDGSVGQRDLWEALSRGEDPTRDSPTH